MKRIFQTGLFILSLSVAAAKPSYPEKKPTSIEAAFSSDITGSYHGTNLCPMLSVVKSNGVLSAGPNFQSRKMNLSGFQVMFQRTFSPNKHLPIKPFLYGSGIFHQSAYLGKGYVKMGDCQGGENPVDCRTLRFKTMELYTGFGIKITHNDYISSSWSIGAGFYNTLGNYEHYQNMLREKASASLQLKCVINYHIYKQ